MHYASTGTTQCYVNLTPFLHWHDAYSVAVVVLSVAGYMGYSYYKTKKVHAGVIGGLCSLMTLGYLFNL